MQASGAPAGVGRAWGMRGRRLAALAGSKILPSTEASGISSTFTCTPSSIPSGRVLLSGTQGTRPGRLRREGGVLRMGGRSRRSCLGCLGSQRSRASGRRQVKPSGRRLRWGTEGFGGCGFSCCFLGVVAGDGTKEDVFFSEPTSTPAIFTVFSLLSAKLIHPLLAQMPLPRHTAPLPTTPHKSPLLSPSTYSPNAPTPTFLISRVTFIEAKAFIWRFS